MEDVRKLVYSNNLQIEYLVYGNGHETVICIHGHGRTAEDFEFLKSPKRKVISINLFFHGNSTFPAERIENKPLRLEEFNHLFQQIIESENVQKFHLLAFSQGGRFSLCLIPFYATKLISVTLIAPDGMDNSSFYNWSSRQKWARKLFINFEKKPSRLIRLSNIATKLKLMRPKVRAFVHQFASNENSFKKASLSWRTFRNILPDNAEISSTLNKEKIPFVIIMGEYDQVIRPKQAYQFAKKIGLPDCVVEVPNGHDFFKKSSINKFIHLLPFV